MRDPRLEEMRHELVETIETIESRRSEWSEYARSLAGSLVGFWQKQVRQTAAKLSAQSQEIHRMVAGLPPVAAASWEASAWKALTPTAELLTDVRIGRLTDPNAESLSPAASLDAPLMVPLIGSRGPLVLSCESSSAERVRGAIQSLLLRVGFGVPDARFTLLSPLARDGGFPVVRHLRGVRERGSSPVDDLRAVSREIAQIHREVLYDVSSIHELAPEDRPAGCFEFIVVADYPHGYTAYDDLASILSSIAASGPAAGRYLIVEHRTDQAEPRGLRVQSLEHATVVPAGQPSVWGLKLALDTPPGEERMRSLFEHVEAVPSGRPRMIGLS